MINQISGTSASSTASAAGSIAGAGGAMGKKEFLQLLVTQMRNQNPLDPMKGEDFAAQLAQFSSLEQQIDTNTQLQGQSSLLGMLLSGTQAQSALSSIGHTVTAVGNGVAVGAGGEGAVSFDVGTGGGTATLKVMDAAGKVVGTRDLGTLGAGRQKAELGSAADGLPAGNYTYAVEVKDASGAAVTVKTYTTGRVDGVRIGSSGPVLTCGGMEIPLGAVIEVRNN